MTHRPRLRAIDGDPVRLLEALRAAWGAGDAGVVMGEAGVSALPTATQAALRGDLDLPPDTALVVPTSGSSGAPRSVILSHGALKSSTSASLERLGCEPGERWILALPTRHIGGLQVLARSSALGTAPIVVEKPGDPLAIGAAIGEGEHIAIVPTQLLRCLDAGVPLRRLHTVLVGGAALSDHLMRRALDAGVPLVRSYGMTEMSGGCVYDGRPLDGVEVLVDAGAAILLRGPMRANGYLERPPGEASPFIRGGWYRTNDLGALTDGILTVLGRRDDVIISGGAKVSASHIEARMPASPDIADVAVVGVPDEEWGERVRIIVRPEAPGTWTQQRSAQALDEFRRALSDTVPRTHLPTELLAVERLDRTALGKIPAVERKRIADLGTNDDGSLRPVTWSGLRASNPHGGPQDTPEPTG
jgi:O-succinylbenzoic acid--CoA ligase